MKVLICDDDRDLVELVAFALKRAGFEVVRAHESATALQLIQDEQPDLAVLDVNLGYTSGFDLLRQIRRTNQLPVIMLTARDAEEDKVRGLELGADDYVVKPFSYRELIARIRTNLRRHSQDTAPAPPDHLEVGPLTLNAETHTALKGEQLLKLTVTEFRLLHFLMASAGKVVPTRTLLRQVWGYDDPNGADIIRVTVHRLRRKVEDNPANPHLLLTIPGVGVMLKAEADGRE
ncbi:MAG: response regulator transcription factor [Chloroflexota bacterium]